jgi:CheY-like chemotaxis protein
MIRSTLESIHPLCQRKKIKLELRLDKNLPEYLFSDEDKMQQVFINVLNNAVKFTEKGRITFTAKAEKRGAKIAFSIADTGIGMTQPEVDSIFEPYRQIDHSEKKNTGGTGLGLSISKQIWELVGGAISVTSKKGKGTEVMLELPVQKHPEKMESRVPAQSSAARADGGHEIAPPSSRKKTVLLVDDNPDNQYAAKFILEDRGYCVVFARDGGEGVEKAIQTAPDLILMDMMMPGVDGYQATRKIRAVPALKNVPIIAMTAKTIQEDKQQAIKSGCNEYLTKPFNLDEMTRKVDKWLKGSK